MLLINTVGTCLVRSLRRYGIQIQGPEICPGFGDNLLIIFQRLRPPREIDQLPMVLEAEKWHIEVWLNLDM